jgi:DNA-binding transcriptional regulator YiaG
MNINILIEIQKNYNGLMKIMKNSNTLITLNPFVGNIPQIDKIFRTHMKRTPNYRKIYEDMIAKKYPDKAEACRSILNKKNIKTIDVVMLNNIIVGFDSHHIENNQKLKSYDKDTVFEILMYQKKHHLNNMQTAKYFNISRNTLSSWKKKFTVEFKNQLPES